MCDSTDASDEREIAIDLPKSINAARELPTFIVM